MTFLLPYRFCQCSSSLKFCVFPIFRLKQVICLTWLSNIYKVKHGQRKKFVQVLFKSYMFIEALHWGSNKHVLYLFRYCICNALPYEYIYIKSTVILAETCDAILFYSVILRKMYLRKFVNNVPISTDYK